MTAGEDNLFCPHCGSKEPAFATFCGGCGAGLDGPLADSAAASDTSAAGRAPRSTAPIRGRSDDLPQKGVGRGLGAAMGGGLAAFGLAILLFVVLVATNTLQFGGDGDSGSSDSGSSDSSGPTVGGAEAAELPPDSASSGREAVASAPSAAQLQGANEVDRPGDYPYAAARASCSEHKRVSDAVKSIGVDLDKELRETTAISEAKELELGNSYVRELEVALGGKLEQGPTARYLARVAAPLLEGRKRQGITYTFHTLENTEILNALALPGGHIVVTRPMMNQWPRNEAQLAAILGHEIAHVDERHPLAVYQYAKTLGLPEDDLIGRSLIMMAQTPYSSGLEEEADRLGAALMHRARYSVFQAVALWAQVAKDGPSAAPAASDDSDPFAALAGAVLQEFNDLVASHPAPARRSCKLKQQAYDLFQEQGVEQVYVGATNLKRSVAMKDGLF